MGDRDPMACARNVTSCLVIDLLGLGEIDPRPAAIFPIRFGSGREGTKSGLMPTPVSTSCVVAEKEKQRDGHEWQ